MEKLKHTISGWRVRDWIFALFSFSWVLFLVLDYWNKHPLYKLSLENFKYPVLSTFLILSGVLLGAIYSRKWIFSRWRKLPLNGLIVLVMTNLLVVATVISFNKFWKAPLDVSHYFHVVGLTTYVLFGGFVLCLASFSVGRRFRKLILLTKSDPSTLWMVDICLGFMLYMFCLFILGLLNLLFMPVVLGLLTSFIVFNYKYAWQFTQKILWKSIKIPSEINYWGMLFGWLLLALLAINLIYSLSPFPLGFDARNYYVSISKLIFESNGLISGYQPYSWSLIMATGYIAFDSPSITMFISSLGGILCLFACYDLFTRHFDVNKNYTLAALFIFVATPAVSNQWIIEFKIDLTLLFVQLVIVNFVLMWLFSWKKKVNSLIQTKRDYKVLIILSLLMGFTLTIKVLSIFLLFGAFIALWAWSKDIYGMLFLALSAFGLVLVLQLDEISGLRSYHNMPTQTGLASIALGLISLGMSWYQNKTRWFQNVKTLLIGTFFIGLVFSPWILKNISDSGPGASLTNIIIGNTTTDKISVQDIQRNYESLRNQNGD